MCRLSIVVPYDRDEAAFETTLVSVLENRPDYCEVIVSHDGRYQDPFDLGDEVRFVVADKNDQVSLIKAAVTASLGRVVHIMTGGVRATENWVDQPVSMFEQSDLGCVAPVIRDMSDPSRIVAAGWRDTSGRLQQPIGRGSESISKRELGSVQGAFLAASFWRRSTLDGLLSVPVSGSVGATDYVLAYGLQKAGWRCRLAVESELVASATAIRPVVGTVGDYAAIQAFRGAVGKGKGFGAALSALLGTLLSPTDGTAWSEALGRCKGAFSSSDSIHAIVRELKSVSQAIGPDAATGRVLKMPHVVDERPSLRRAA